MSANMKQSSETSTAPIRTSSSLAGKSTNTTQEPDQIVYEKLTLTLADNGHAVYIEAVKNSETTREVECEATPEGYIVRNLQNYSEREVKGWSFIEGSVGEFVEILKIPELHLKQLVIDLEPPESVCRKIEAAHQIYHPEDEEFKFKCTVPECIRTLHNRSSQTLLQLLKHRFELLNFELSVERFEVEFKGYPYQIHPIISALQPITLKEIVINSEVLCLDVSELVHSEQWKEAEQLDCFGGITMDVEHWKHFKTIDIELRSTTKEELDGILKTFLFLSTWERVSMQFRSCDVPRNEYFEEFNIAETTVIPGIVDNWVIEVPKMNHRVFVIFCERTLHMLRRHWVEDQKELVEIRRTVRKAEVTLVEMPDVLARNIAGQLDEMSRRSLAQTCRFLKHIVSTTESIYEKLTLTLADNRPAIFVELLIDSENRLELEFERHPLGYIVRNPQEGWEQTVLYKQYRHGLEPGIDFIGGAMNHFLKIFTKKTVVKKLCIVTEDPARILRFLHSVVPWYHARQDIMDSYLQNFTPNMKNLKETLLRLLSRKQHSLKVQHFEVQHGETFDNTALVIKYLDPNVLQRISISGSLYRRESQEIASCTAWKRAQELFCSTKMPANYWSHFPKAVISISSHSNVPYIEDILNALLVSTTWNNVSIESRSVSAGIIDFFNRLEDQRPAASRIPDSKLIRIPSNPNQFINCQLISRRQISFTRVVQ